MWRLTEELDIATWRRYQKMMKKLLKYTVFIYFLHFNRTNLCWIFRERYLIYFICVWKRIHIHLVTARMSGDFYETLWQNSIDYKSRSILPMLRRIYFLSTKTVVAQALWVSVFMCKRKRVEKEMDVQCIDKGYLETYFHRRY